MRRLLLLLILPLLLPTPAFGERDDDDDEENDDLPTEEEFEGEEDDFIIEDSPFEQLEVACIERQDGDACFEAGQGWAEGKGLERPNLTQAGNLWEAGCTWGHPQSCLGAGMLFLKGEVGITFTKRRDEAAVVHFDLARASILLRGACEGGILAACAIGGDLLMAPEKMVPADAKFGDFEMDMLQGRQSYETGCPALSDINPVWKERDADCCVRLARIWEEGHGVRRNAEVAMGYWDLACAAQGGEGEACGEAQRIRVEAVDPPPEEAPRESVQPQRPKPKTDRFNDPSLGIVGPTSRDHTRRFELELGLGARVRYPDPVLALFKLRAGLALWFNVIGFGLDTAFSTDKFAAVQYRLITRFQQSFALKTAIPIKVKLPWGAVMRVGFGAGPTFGAVKYHPAPYVFGAGIREYIQLELGSGQLSGPRQWGAIRIEQQQTWHVGGGVAPEHSTQLVLVAGFTFAGRGPDWTPNNVSD